MNADALHNLALRLSTAFALAKEAGHSEVDAWRNVALVAQRDAERVDGTLLGRSLVELGVPADLIEAERHRQQVYVAIARSVREPACPST